MKKLASLLVALSLSGADPWQSKPFTEWSDKDVQKLLSSSPWSRSISVSMASADTPGFRGRGGLDGDDTMQRRGASEQMPGAADVGAPGGNVASRSMPDAPSGQSVTLLIRWQSALPVKQALARRKFAAEAETSPEAQKFLNEDAGYLISLSGLSPSVGRIPQTKVSLLQGTVLSAKGKESLHPTDIQMSPPGKTVEAIFVFPKTTPFTLDDKEVEFSTQLGTLAVRYKFRLKDMVLNGKLEL